MARRSKLTPSLQAAFLQAVRVGATYKIACAFAGVSEAAFYRWCQLGEGGRSPYKEFVEAVKKTDGLAAVGWLAKIETAASEGNWQAAAWKLERRYPEEYGRQIVEQKHEVGEGLALLLKEHQQDGGAQSIKKRDK